MSTATNATPRGRAQDGADPAATGPSTGDDSTGDDLETVRLVNGLSCGSRERVDGDFPERPLEPPEALSPLFAPLNQRNARVTGFRGVMCFGATGIALSSMPGRESAPSSRITSRRSFAK